MMKLSSARAQRSVAAHRSESIKFCFACGYSEHHKSSTNRVFTYVVGGRVGMNDTCGFTFDMKKLDHSHHAKPQSSPSLSLKDAFTYKDLCVAATLLCHFESLPPPQSPP